MTHKPGHADTRRFRHLLMAIAMIFLAACGSREEAAFLTFSKAYSCPRSNMAVTPIENVTISELRLRALPQGKPPAAVQADPARLAPWQDPLAGDLGPDGAGQASRGRLLDAYGTGNAGAGG